MNDNKSIISVLLICVVTLTSCQEEKTFQVNLKDVIECAEAIPFDSLDVNQQNKINYCSYFPYGNWRDTKEYKKEQAFFIKAKINNALLAELCKSDVFPVETLLDSNFYSLYGKYRNSWKLFDDQHKVIDPSNKFEGHDIFEINRIGNIDYIIIGPIQTHPYKMEIDINNENCDANPEFVLTKNCY